MTRLRHVVSTVAFCMAALATTPAAHAAADPAEIAFWQSVDATKDPREYQLYLQMYPNGAFAAIARARSQGSSGPVLPIPLPAPGPAPVPEPEPVADDGGPALTVTPASGRVGQLFTIGCVNLPENGSQDVIIIVRAGSPVLPPDANSPQLKVLKSVYSQNCAFYHNQIPGLGPFAPGNYEVRFMSVLYNDDHAFEMKAKVEFSVR